MDYYDRRYLQARRKRAIFWKAVVTIALLGTIGLCIVAAFL